MRIYGEITKLEPQDDGTLRVIGVASSGALDAADERVAPAAMKAALPEYMRFGALREMHGMSAAGATLGADVDDQGLTRIEAHVVDPLAVKKVKLGVYKGFSIGGRVTARDPTDPKLITGLKLDEISLVDRPCNPEAVIEMWKADAAALGIDERTQSPPIAAEAIAPKPFAKRGARNSAEDLARIQAAHDQLVALGAQCGDDDDPDKDDDEDGDFDDDSDGDPADDTPDDAPDETDDEATDKALRARLTRLAGHPDRAGGLAHKLDELRRVVTSLQKRLDELAAEPRPPKAIAGWARAVTKAEDAGAAPEAVSPQDLRKYLDSLSPEDRARLELRAALSRPITADR